MRECLIFAAGLYVGQGCAMFDQLRMLNPDAPRRILALGAVIWPVFPICGLWEAARRRLRRGRAVR